MPAGPARRDHDDGPHRAAPPARPLDLRRRGFEKPSHGYAPRHDVHLPDLPYAENALEPFYSAEVLALHHGKHHKAYVEGRQQDARPGSPKPARRATTTTSSASREALRLQPLGPRAPHALLAEPQPPTAATSRPATSPAAIDEHFGTFDAFQAQMTRAVVTVQGSGWGAPRVGAARSAPLRRADLRPPGQRRPERPEPARHRRVGARVLPAVQERAPRLREGDLEHRQLGRRHGTLRPSVQDGVLSAPALAGALAGRLDDEDHSLAGRSDWRSRWSRYLRDSSSMCARGAVSAHDVDDVAAHLGVLCTASRRPRS